jgi:hypothetical protein
MNNVSPHPGIYFQKLEEAKRRFFTSLGDGRTISDFEYGFQLGWYARGQVEDGATTPGDAIARANHEESEYFKKHPIQDDAGYGVESEEEDDGGDNGYTPRQS